MTASYVGASSHSTILLCALRPAMSNRRIARSERTPHPRGALPKSTCNWAHPTTRREHANRPYDSIVTDPCVAHQVLH